MVVVSREWARQVLEVWVELVWQIHGLLEVSQIHGQGTSCARWGGFLPGKTRTSLAEELPFLTSTSFSCAFRHRRPL